MYNKDEKVFDRLRITEEGKKAIKKHIHDIIYSIVGCHDVFEGGQVKPYLTEFIFDNYWEAIYKYIENTATAEADKSFAHFTLITSHIENGQVCNNWTIDNEIDACYRMARHQFTDDEDYKGKDPKFLIFDNWEDNVYGHEDVMKVIQRPRVTVFTGDGTCLFDKAFPTLEEAETVFAETAKNNEEDLKGNTMNIMDFRPNGVIIKGEKIITLDGREITIQITDDGYLLPL